ncbi:class II aldolase/adducin family protein [Sphingorhabdus sp.]|jgi:ribulose-5-phosphate 4-epimerase/fuculose-1-phosphate aldolase|uniref:class II aldolase/adducin family protein n=1 Tax=Sphingorhabdus sp. TaxID=1902408 RepID=UPI0037C649EB
MQHVTPANDDEATEWDIRRNLAAFYRIAAHMGWDDLLATHISARLPGDGEVFLINPLGLLFEEVTASNLVKVNGEGQVLGASEYGINQAGFVIHSAVHRARPDAGCVVHLHSRSGVAVSATKDGLLPLNQSAIILGQEIAFHDFEGIAFDLDEQPRLAQDLGQSNVMFLRNHGTLVLGSSIAEAFARTYSVEWSCDVQVRTLGMAAPLYSAAPDAIATVAAQTSGDWLAHYAENLLWPAIVRKVTRLDPNFAD